MNVEKAEDYQLVKALHDMTEDIEWMNADVETVNEHNELLAEIEKRKIRLTKGLVQKWWRKHNKGLTGRMQWKQPRGYNHWWQKDTVAVYSYDGLSIVYLSLAAICSDIGDGRSIE